MAIQIRALKNDDIGRAVEYENKNRKIKPKKGKIFSWNTMHVFVCFGSKAKDDFNLDGSTACNPQYLSFIDGEAEK